MTQEYDLALASDMPMELGVLQQVLTHLPATVFPAKGFIHAVEKSQRRLVFIARHGTVNVAAVEKALKGCQATAVRRAS